MKNELKVNDDKVVYIITLLMLIFIVIMLIIGTIVPTDESFYKYCSIFLAVMAVYLSVKNQVDHNKSINMDNKAIRRVKMLKSISPLEIEEKIERLYANELQGKSIDKIEIVNTSIGQNDNRKDVIIIYH